jgi:hypothetical protein
MTTIGQVSNGNGLDGVGWDPIHRTVSVSDQCDGALSLIANAGGGRRVQMKLGGARRA